MGQFEGSHNHLVSFVPVFYSEALPRIRQILSFVKLLKIKDAREGQNFNETSTGEQQKGGRMTKIMMNRQIQKSRKR